MNLWDVFLLWYERRRDAAPEPQARDELSTLGKRGEAAAAKYLKKLGYQLLAQSSRSKLGELDLIALDGNCIVFVEVKTRRSTDAGHASEAVDDKKQAKITRLALAYLKRHRMLDHPTRFDVIAITWPSDDGEPKIEHYKNAFEATGRNSMYS
jgi:putative endonuclease